LGEVKLYLNGGGSVDKQNSVSKLFLLSGLNHHQGGWTPLSMAASNGQLEVTSMLIDQGAIIDYQTAVMLTQIFQTHLCFPGWIDPTLEGLYEWSSSGGLHPHRSRSCH
jgi:hypothetical protein